jgi:glucokinase
MSKLLCGVDMGGTKCSIALVNLEGGLLDKIYSCAHVDLEDEGRVEMVVEHIGELLARNRITETDLEGIGVGCAGHIRYRDGIIITTSNLSGFKNYPLRDQLQSHFSIPVVLDNDTNAQALGEFRYGAGKGYDDMVFITLSTGIGAGIILNRKLYRGQTGTAGEFGHTIIDPESDLVCTCGNRGCLMACACGLALPHLFEKKLRSGMRSLLDLPPHFNMAKLSGQVLKKGLDMGDPVSMEVISDSARYVGIGIYNLFQVLNPPLIVLGGGLTNWGEFYLNRIKETFYELARDMIFDPIEITLSRIIGDAGVIGAAALTLENEYPEL